MKNEAPLVSKVSRPCNRTVTGMAFQKFLTEHFLTSKDAAKSWYQREKSAFASNFDAYFFAVGSISVSFPGTAAFFSDPLYVFFGFLRIPSGFHCLINRYVYPLNHSIARHSDSKAFYDACDPIASFSMRLGSVLLVNIKGSNGLSRKGDAGQVTRAALAIWQPPNSILIMGGNFQDQFEHSLPSWADMRTLSMKEDDSNFFSCEADLFRIWWCGSSKKDFQLGMDWMSSLALQRQPLENARWNVTLRWIREHLTEDCPRASESSFANRRIEDLQGTGQAAGASSSSTPPWALQQDAPRQVSAAASQPLPPQSLPPWALLQNVPDKVSAEASQPGAPGLPEPPPTFRFMNVYVSSPVFCL